jgi:hypothetical protein
MICDPELENSVYRRRYNFDLETEFDSPCVINIVKTNRWGYAGTPQKANFIARSQGTRRQGRPKSRWADEVNSEQIGRTELRIESNGKNFFDRL